MRTMVWASAWFSLSLGMVAVIGACGSSSSTHSPSPAATPTSPSTVPVIASAVPTAAAGSPAASAVPATATPTAPSVDVMIGQMLMAGVDGTAVGADATHVIGDLHIGNVILLGRNVSSPAQVLALDQGLQKLAIAANGIPLFIATDQEGGTVQRLLPGFTRLPDAVAVGAVDDPSLTQKLGQMTGEEMAAVGVTTDLGPVLDVNDNPNNPVIGPRSFGPVPGVVERNGVAFMQGLHDAGVMAVGKHFPGHGDTSQDSHYSLATVNKDIAGLRAVELPPFQKAIEAGIDGLMVAHVAYPALDSSGLPATVSAPIVTDLLRGQLGFTGVTFTDDMGMQGISSLMSPQDAAVRAVLAGADIVLCGRIDQEGSCSHAMLEQLRDGLLAAVKDGRISMARVQASYLRITAAKLKYAMAVPTGRGLGDVGSAAHAAVVGAITGP